MTDKRVSEMSEAERVRRCNSCPGPASCSEFGRCVLEVTETASQVNEITQAYRDHRTAEAGQ
jgi:hypothetical protein